MERMSSHEYAARLRAEASYLEAKPAFDMPSYTGLAKESYWYMGDKEGFIRAVRTLGAGQKSIGPEYVEFHPADAPVAIRIERQHVCRLVKPAEYDCEPFLAPEEEAVMDAAVAGETRDTSQDVPF
jgi:hypothetical protein